MTTAISAERPDAADAIALIEELEAELVPLYPRESRHGYSVQKLISQGVAFFVARVGFDWKWWRTVVLDTIWA